MLKFLQNFPAENSYLSITKIQTTIIFRNQNNITVINVWYRYIKTFNIIIYNAACPNKSNSEQHMINNN